MAVAQFPTTGGMAPCTPDVHRIWDGDIRAIKGGRSAVYLFLIYLSTFGELNVPMPPSACEEYIVAISDGDIDGSGGCPTFFSPIRGSPGWGLRRRDKVFAVMVITRRLETGIPASDVLQGSADFTVILRTDINLIAEVGGRHPMPMVQWGVPVQGIQ